MGKWYDAGFKEALAGLNPDPPLEPGKRPHGDYLEGFEDAQRQLDSEADYDRVNSRPRRL